MQSVVLRYAGRSRLPAASDIMTALVSLFFVLMLVMPTASTRQRALLLAIIVVMNLVAYSHIRKIYISREVFIMFYAMLFTSLLSALNGIILSAPGVVNVLTVFVVWPLLYIFLMGIVRNIEFYETILRCVVMGSIIAAATGILLVVSAFFGGLTFFGPFFSELGAITGLYDGYIEYSLPNIGTIIYAIPFFLAMLLIRNSGHHNIARQSTILFALLLCILSGLLSGRRALLLIIIISPMIVFILARLSNIKLSGLRFALLSAVSATLTLVVAIPVFNLDIEVIFEMFSQGFRISSIDSSSAPGLRALQFSALIESWLERPLFGHGIGASSRYLVRSDTQPWAYELSYVALLFQTGVFGVLMYSGGVTWLFLRGILVMRQNSRMSQLLLPTLSGLACFLIANATNPYLGKFDFLWVLFLPVGIVNASLLMRSR
ncbi:MAG: hypothetical protein ACSHX3_16490 [Litorimonas sp.]